MNTIDAFCHLMPSRYAELAMEAAPASSHMFARAMRMPAMSDMEYRRRLLSRYPGYVQIPNIVSPPVEALAGPDKSPGIAAIGNDEIHDIVERDPELYAGFIGSIPANNIPASLEEIRRCKDMGARGIQIYTHINGEPIDSERFWPVYEECVRNDLPILVHPVGGQRMPEYMSEEYSRYELWYLIGWPYQTTVAMARLVFSGIFEDFPDIRILTHHCGAMIPMLGGRIGNGLKMYGSRTAMELRDRLTRTRLKENPIDAFRRFYVDTATCNSATAIRCGLDFYGAGHVLFATDMPFDPEDGAYIEGGIKAISSLELDESQQEAIFHRNAEVFFGL